MTDGLNNMIAFSGSANETGQAFTENYETIDVYCDWKSDEAYSRCYAKDTRFDKMWDGDEDNLIVIAIVVDKNIRYERLSKRDIRSLNNLQAKDRDIAEIENLAKGGPISYADFYILNNGSLNDYEDRMLSILKEI